MVVRRGRVLLGGRGGRGLLLLRLLGLPILLGNDLLSLLLLDGLGEGLLKLMLLKVVVVFQINLDTSVLQGIVSLVSDDLVLRVIIKCGGGICIDPEDSNDTNDSN